MYSLLALTLLGVHKAAAFPWVAAPGTQNLHLLAARQQNPDPDSPGSAANCPYNPNHVPAAPVTAKYPYNNAVDGKPGDGKGGFLVPDPADDAHRFIAPDYAVDIRGPCPGLNALANHNFLAHDGITTYNELVDAQQNVYNVGYDLANLLATLGLTTTDGDIVTGKLSLGCDATNRTSYNTVATGSEPGLDGHNKFETDSSITRNDYFTHGGENYRLNTTLFQMMTETSGGNYSLDQLALYRSMRYEQSRAENPNFYFGPFSLLLFGAASFLYELMPSGTRNYAADFYTISSFYGVDKTDNGEYVFNGKEKIPDNWTTRMSPFSSMDAGSQIIAMYEQFPVMFGGNTGDGTFDALTFGKNGQIEEGMLKTPDAANVMCLLYQIATERVPSSLNGFVTPSVEAVNFAVSKLQPGFDNLGCPYALT